MDFKKEMNKRLSAPEKQFVAMIVSISERYDLDIIETTDMNVNAILFLLIMFAEYCDENEAVDEMLKQAEEVLKDA